MCDKEPLPLHRPDERRELLCHLGPAMADSPILEVRNLSKTYRVRRSIGLVETVQAAQDVSFEVDRGQHTWHRRGERLGQVHRGALPARTHASNRRGGTA